MNPKRYFRCACLVLFLAAAASCSSKPKEKSRLPAAPSVSEPAVLGASVSPFKTPLRKQSIEDLLKMEFSRPADPGIKEELARQYWCQGNRGFAIEHWLWNRQFLPQTQWAERAQAFLSRARSDPDEVSVALSCKR